MSDDPRWTGDPKVTTYRGRVRASADDGERVVVSLTASDGTAYVGEIQRDVLVAAGIGAEDPFTLFLETRLRVEKTPRRELSEEEQTEIYRRIEEEFRDFGEEGA